MSSRSTVARAAFIPPAARTVWASRRPRLPTTSTRAPASWAAIAARSPPPPVPMTSTSVSTVATSRSSGHGGDRAPYARPTTTRVTAKRSLVLRTSRRPPLAEHGGHLARPVRRHLHQEPPAGPEPRRRLVHRALHQRHAGGRGVGERPARLEPDDLLREVAQLACPDVRRVDRDHVRSAANRCRTPPKRSPGGTERSPGPGRPRFAWPSPPALGRGRRRSPVPADGASDGQCHRADPGGQVDVHRRRTTV